MILSVTERLMLLGLLPQESDFSTLKILRNLKDDLGFAEDEIAEINLTVVETNYRWDTAKATDKDIPIGAKATSIIVGALTEMDKDKRLSDQHFTLYEKFIETDEQEAENA